MTLLQQNRCVATALRLAALLLVGSLGGCAAMTNPVAYGVPVRNVPPEMLGGSKDCEQPIPMNLLRQQPAKEYRLAAGDVLGIWIEGILDKTGTSPPLFPKFSDLPTEKPSILPQTDGLPAGQGYPILVRQDGIVNLPRIKPVKVLDKTLEEAEKEIYDAYVDKAKILNADQRVAVTLLRPRTVKVTVFRQDTNGPLGAQNPNPGLAVTTVGTFNFGSNLIGVGATGTGQEVDLPAYENDVLHALVKTGGFPGISAAADIVIYRDVARTDKGDRFNPTDFRIIKIPLRFVPGSEKPFAPDDIVLRNGDVLYVEAYPRETFYSAGLLPPAEHVLPHYDLDVVEAIARVGGPMVNGAFGGNNLAGNLIERGIGGPSPSLLTVIRRTPNGGHIPIRVNLNAALNDSRERILVQPGDVLILQETKCEALARYSSEVFDFSIIWRAFISSRATGTVNVAVP